MGHCPFRHLPLIAGEPAQRSLSRFRPCAQNWESLACQAAHKLGRRTQQRLRIQLPLTGHLPFLVNAFRVAASTGIENSSEFSSQSPAGCVGASHMLLAASGLAAALSAQPVDSHCAELACIYLLQDKRPGMLLGCTDATA